MFFVLFFYIRNSGNHPLLRLCENGASVMETCTSYILFITEGLTDGVVVVIL